jgi:hypothetical protein
VEEEIGEKPVELNHDSGSESKPNRCKNRSGGKILLHDFLDGVDG